MKKLLLIISIFITLNAFSKNIERYEVGEQSYIKVTCENMSYIMMLKDKKLLPVYFGKRIDEKVAFQQDRARHNGPFELDEIPTRGLFADKNNIIEALFSDGTRDIELEVTTINILEREGDEVLEVNYRDKHYPFKAKLFMKPIYEFGIIEKWLEVSNESKNKGDIIKFDNIMSASIYLNSGKYFLTHHSGEWLNEFNLRTTELTPGNKVLQSRDFTSFENTPWFVITEDETPDKFNSAVWFGQLHYSGNWKMEFGITNGGHLQITSGINFWDTEVILRPGETFTTPKFSFGFSSKGTEGAILNNNKYIKQNILPKKNAYNTRPIIYNSWYATGFGINEQQQLKLAKVAREIGVELFVIDDGWFKGRKNDKAGLGDWTVDKEKFPNGLNPLIDSINRMGMKFGIWVEPEMINPNSDLYKKHPEWVMAFNNRTRSEWRNQLTLNLAREDVYNYLLNSMRELLRNHKIDFVKWDRNRGLSQPGTTDITNVFSKDIRIKYISNLYRLIDSLKSEFPNTIFENCSSGGGRPDLGMLSRMDQTWTSDQTDPVERLSIQYGYLHAYPSNTMVCWTSSYSAHNITYSDEFIFNVAMQGVLGIGDNIAKWNEAKRQYAANKINEFKSIRETIHNGTTYRLVSPYKTGKVALEYLSEDKKEVILMCYNIENQTNAASDKRIEWIKLVDLPKGKRYILNDNEVFSSEQLINIGVKWPINGILTSKILRFKMID